jgi:hypothetical protein
MYEALEFEDEDYLELEGEDEDYLEAEMEDEDYLEAEMEDEDYLEAEMEDEDYLGDILSGVLGSELENPIGETEERELAAELLEVQNEDELEQFLGNLFKSAVKGIGNFAKSGVGQALGGVLKNVAKTALPMVGGALSTMIAPGIGTSIGSKLGNMAGGLFELEDEVAGEELEFEVARRVVRIGAAAAKHAAHAAPDAHPAKVARSAVVKAVRAHAPAVLPRSVQPRYRQRHPVVGQALRRPAHPSVRLAHPHAGYRGPVDRRRVGSRSSTGQRIVLRHPVATARSGGYRRPRDVYGGRPYGGAGAVRRAPAPYAAPRSAAAVAERTRGVARARTRRAGQPGVGWASWSYPIGWGASDGDGTAQSGRWYRRGGRIVIVGV